LGSKKGQVWSLDIASAAVVISFILLFAILIWNNLAIRWNSTNDYRQMQTDAMFAAEALMTTSGYPESWEMLPQIDDNITSIGLVNGRNELSHLKLKKLVDENATAYGHVKRRLGVQRYELGIRITDIEREEAYYEFGRFSGALDTVVAFERLGILNGSMVVMQVEVWE